MADKLRLNVQTRVGGILLGVGIHDTENIPAEALDRIKAYQEEQKALPLEKRDVPPYYEIISDVKNVDPHSLKDGGSTDTNVDKYISLNNKELKDLCKQRGIDIKGLKSNKELISALTANDEKELDDNAWENRFLSPDEFLELSAKKQNDYLDDIYGLPDDIDEDSEEADNYSEDLIEAVKSYSALSLDNSVVEKVKEIISYYEE